MYDPIYKFNMKFNSENSWVDLTRLNSFMNN